MIFSSCTRDDFDGRIEIPDFNFPKTIVFQDSLSFYNIFQGTAADLVPSNDFQLLELSSILFTDYARKQRLVKVPLGTQMERLNDGSLDFPNGTILTKTFFYYNDERDTSLGKRIIETRLLIKENEKWNIATYLWNEEQTEALLTLDGHDTQVNWINDLGINRSTVYHVPTENECMTCHQSNSSMTPIGPTLRNLNKEVVRNSSTVNQLSHLQALGILSPFQLSEVPQIVDYHDSNLPISERGRAYLAMNCAHCHNPTGWDATEERDFDFRYDIPLSETGIPFGKDKIINQVTSREMPFIGTTVLDDEGAALLVEYIESL